MRRPETSATDKVANLPFATPSFFISDSIRNEKEVCQKANDAGCARLCILF